MNRPRKLVRCMLVAAWLTHTSPASAQPVALVCDDARLAAAVTAELRAAGLDVHISTAPANATIVVRLAQRRGAKTIEITVSDADNNKEVKRAVVSVARRGGGLAAGDAAALRAAEAVRLLLGTPAESDELPPREPEAPAPSVAPPAAATTPVTGGPTPRPTLARVAVPSQPHPSVLVNGGAADAVIGVPETPIFRAGLFTGAGYAAPSPLLAVGLTGRWSPSVYFNLGAAVTATRNLPPELDVEEVWRLESAGQHASVNDIYGLKVAALASWDILGNDHAWTPSLGAGPLINLRWWSMNFQHIDERRQLASADTLDGSDGGFGFAFAAGVSIAQPWRLRIDVQADLNVATWIMSADSTERVAPAWTPTVIGTAGFEYDLVRQRNSPREELAKRAPE